MESESDDALLNDPKRPAVFGRCRTRGCTAAFAGCAVLLTALAALGARRPRPSNLAKTLEKVVLYQKVRMLRNLTEEDLQRHHVDVVSLPPLEPLFWQRHEAQLLARNLGFSKSLSDGQLTITRESSKDKFVRVSECICDASLISLKLMAAILSLEASIHVCNLPSPKAASKPDVQEFEKVWLGNRRLSGPPAVSAPAHAFHAFPRRLAFNIPATTAANLNVKEAQMSCASQINGILSSLLYVDQYVADSIYTCPPPNEVKSLYPAKCAMSIGVLTGGIFKAAAALSDIAVECKSPIDHDVPYAKTPEKDREGILLAACLNNVGQGTTYVAKIGYQLDDIATSPGVCPEEYPTQNEREVCTENIASLLADIGQVVTYLSAAASSCGDQILVPFSCTSRVAAVVTGLFDVAQGVGGSLAWCDHPGIIQRKIAKQWTEIEEKIHDKRYSHNFPL